MNRLFSKKAILLAILIFQSSFLLGIRAVEKIQSETIFNLWCSYPLIQLQNKKDFTNFFANEKDFRTVSAIQKKKCYTYLAETAVGGLVTASALLLPRVPALARLIIAGVGATAMVHGGYKAKKRIAFVHPLAAGILFRLSHDLKDISVQGNITFDYESSKEKSPFKFSVKECI